MPLDRIAEAIRRTAFEELLPRFGLLDESQIIEKSPGEVVTEADRACEIVLTERLRSIRDVPVVGEEAAEADATLTDLVDDRPAVWLVDPLDGTANFAAGRDEYAVMVAFVEAGEATAAWIWQPSTTTMFEAVRGKGAFCNGQRVVAASPESEPLHGVVKDRFFPPSVAEAVAGKAADFAPFDAGRGCAGVEYPNLVLGRSDFLVYWRTLPWDHAPGVLFAEEAGCLALRPDGSRYRCGSSETGLVIAHQQIAVDLPAMLGLATTN